MPLNVLGGALEFEAEINLGTFEEQVKQMEDMIADIAKKAMAGGKSQADAISEIIKAINPNGSPAIEGTIAKIKELQVEEQKILELMEKTKDPALLNQYEQSIQKVRDLLDKSEGTLNAQVEQEIVNNVKAATDSLNVATGGTTSALSQLRAIKNELIHTDKNDPRFAQLLEDATHLEHEIRNVNKQLELSSSNVAGVEALGQGVRGLLGGFEALSGVMSVFGDNNEAVEKSTRHVIAAMGILNGVEEVGKVLAKDSALNTYLLALYRKFAATSTAQQAVATEALVVAEGEQAVATEAAAVAQTELNAAMYANPAGLILLAIVAVVAAIQFFSSEAENATEKQKEMNDALAEANTLLVELTESYASLHEETVKKANRDLELAQAAGKSEAQILDLKEKAINAERTKNVYKLASLGMDTKSISLKKTELEMIDEQILSYTDLLALGGKLSDDEKERLEALKSQKKAIESILNPAQAIKDQIDTGDTELDKIKAEKEKKAREDSLKSDSAQAAARLILVRKNTEDELQLQIQAIRKRSAEELADVNLTSGERARIRAQEQKDIEDAQKKYRLFLLNAGKEEMQARLAMVAEGSAEELDLKKGIINQTAAIELEQEGISQERKKRIRAEEVKALSELYKKTGLENAATELSTAISISQARLSVVKEGTAEELNLKQILVQQKSLLDINSAVSQIKNQKLLAAKIAEINAKSISDQKKLEDDFTDFQLQNIFKVNEQQRLLANTKLEGVLGDPTASNAQKNNAQLKALENSRKEIIDNIFQVELDITRNVGNTNKLLELRKDLYQKLLDLENQINNQGKKNDIDRFNSIIAASRKVIDAFGALGELAGEFNSGLGDSIAQMVQLGKTVLGVADDFKKFNEAKDKKDSIGQVAAGAGIVGAIVGVVTNIVNNLKKAKQSKKEADQQILDFQNKLITGEQEYQAILRERARQLILNNKLTIDGILAQRQLLQAQKKENIDAFADISKKLNDEKFLSGLTEKEKSNFQKIMEVAGSAFVAGKTSVKEIFDSLAGKSFDQLEELFTKGQLTGKAKELFESLQKIKAEGADIDALLEENRKKAEEIFTGTSADSLLDSIVDGFSSGLHSAADFAGTFEDLMRGALINSLKFKYLEGPLKQFFEDFATSSESDGQLTQGEIDQLKSAFNSIITNADQQFQQLQQIAGINLGTNEGNALSGAIKGITEQTAELLAGQFGGLRITAIDQLTLSRQALTVQQSIENNTALSAARLLQLVDKFNSYEIGAKSIKVN
jgi:hypothetical protein